MVLITTLGVLSGVLQALGYIFYALGLRYERDPNPTSWLMWAYGTSLITVLEWDRDATWVELALPVTCSLSSISIAMLCWWKGRMRWPKEIADCAALGADLIITIGYISAWIMLKYGSLTAEEQSMAALAFLLLANATTVTSFIPQLREYASDPRNQSVLPWVTWTTAYATLVLATYLNNGLRSELMIYPIFCTVIHACTVWLIRPSRKAYFETGFLH